MKVLFVNKFFHLHGGAECVFFQERNFLLKQGVAVVDFSMADVNNFYSPFSLYFVPNISYEKTVGLIKKFRQGVGFIHSSVAVRNIEQLIKKEKPEIAHLHNIYHQLTPSIISVLKKNGVKIVLTLHDYKLICPNYLALRNGKICIECAGTKFWNPFMLNCNNSRLQGFLLSVEALFHQWRGSYGMVDIFLSPSRFLANLISMRIAREKIVFLPNGIDVDMYRPDYQDHGYALYFGRLSKEKGVKSLLKAHNELGTSGLPLKIVGTGQQEEKLRKVHSKAEFLGYKTGQDLKDLIAHAAFIVVPTEGYENCSMVILEAMALGKAIIGSRVGGIPEQIEDGKTGFLFEVGNVAELTEKMLILSSDKDLRIQMGYAARKKLKQEYLLAEHNQQLLAIYSGLLS